MTAPERRDEDILEAWGRLSARSRPLPVVRRDPVRTRALRPSTASLAASLAVVVALVAIGVIASRPALQPGGSPTPSGGSVVAVAPSVASHVPSPGRLEPSPTTRPTINPSRNVDAGRLVSATDGWALSNGHLLITHDGGRSWTPTADPAPGVRVMTAAFADGLHGWVVGETYPVEGASGDLVVSVLRTEDGGATWEAVRLATFASPGPDPLIGEPTLSVLSANQVFVMVAFLDEPARASKLFASDDGGRTWDRRSSVRNVWGASFLDESHGWAIRNDTNALVRTSDGGRTWDRARLPAIPGVDPSQLYPAIPIPMPDGRLLMHVRAARDGDAGVFVVSDDGGDRWSIAPGVPQGPAWAVAVLGDGTWILGSHPIQRSADDGATWIPVETDLPQALDSIAVADGTHLSAILSFSCPEGPPGTVVDCLGQRDLWISDDGGSSWRNATP
jgi:photosystem II stability/assembly factor-like uncharacterized protein